MEAGAGDNPIHWACDAIITAVKQTAQVGPPIPLCLFPPSPGASSFFLHPSLLLSGRYRTLCTIVLYLFARMGESWFHREFLVPRRLTFNILFYGAHFGLFAYGWYSQVSMFVFF